jgi:hypothetical protein
MSRKRKSLKRRLIIVINEEGESEVWYQFPYFTFEEMNSSQFMPLFPYKTGGFGERVSSCQLFAA